MRKLARALVMTVALALVAVPLTAEAQSAGKMWLIGYLSQGSRPSPSSPNPVLEAFRQGLRDLGYVEGQNLVIEYRYAEGKAERLPDLAAELVRLKVDVIVAGGTPAPLAAKHATSTIPIVMAAAGDPLGTGLVTNLGKPEGNITGLSNQSIDVTSKRLQLLEEILPRLSRVAVLWNAANIVAVTHMRETEAAARTLGLQLQSMEVRSPDDFENARLERRLLDAIRGGAGALFLIDDPLVFRYHRQVADFTARNRLPATAIYKQFAEAGGLMTFGANLADLFRRAAIFVDKILKGAKPGDLPVEQPTKFELVINLKTAKGLGLTIPQSLLLRADQVIE
jgi:putative tryptophan/tyrosine transport system substrate-binding protein